MTKAASVTSPRESGAALARSARGAGAQPPGFIMRGVAKRFGATVALAGVDLAVAPGEICGLVGQNGAGKSTLMAILAGALRPDAGVMSIGGRPYAPDNPSEARHAGVAMIQQELSLAADLTVIENITLGIEPARFGVLDRARMREIAGAALAELGHDDLPLDAPAGRLSAASQQIVEIARALAVGCPVLVLDEPTSSLGPADVDHLFAVLQRLKSQGHAIVYISHFIEEVLRITDRFVVLRDGRNAGGGATRDATHDEIVSMMVGAAADTVFPRTPRHRGEAILEIDGLEPGGASFTLHRGEILGIAGLMGSGRTRLLRTLFGLAPVRSGRVRVGAYSGAGLPADRWRQGMGLVSEDRTHEGVSLKMSIADNLTLTRLGRFGSGGVVLAGPTARGRAGVDRPHRHQVRRRAADDRGAVRREPAEGRARAPPSPRRGRARARRADPRNRRRQQGADLPADRQPRIRRMPTGRARSSWCRATFRSCWGCATASR